MKEKLGVTDKFVIGHVGRFRFQKNHSFIIDIFKEVCKKEPNSTLLLVGDGPLEEEIKKKVDDLGLLDKVKFLGARDDVNDLMQAMDIFILPSLYEGFGIVLIEAQASGLKCVISDSIPTDAIITKKVKRLSLDDDISIWVEEILSNKSERKEGIKDIEKSKYDITSNAKWLENFYVERWSV